MKPFKQTYYTIWSALKDPYYFGKAHFLGDLFLKTAISQSLPSRRQWMRIWLFKILQAQLLGKFLKKPCFWGILWLATMSLSCGLIGQDFSANRGNNNSLQNSESKDPGTFSSPNGRLTSRNTCVDNADCVEMCDSMLERLYFQRDCYDYKEQEVQALRDTYNFLALGRSNKLSQIKPKDMETFLKFGPVLYESAIYGFTRGWKEDCEPNSGDDDPTEREDCKLENYYQQEGYRSQSAANALKWIAENNWLAKLLLENDEDHIIMLALLKVLDEGGEHPIEDSNEDERQDSFCDGKSRDNSANTLFTGDTPNSNSICGKATESCTPKSSYRNHESTFFRQCLDDNKSYLTIANDDDDEVSDSEELACNLLKEKLCQ